MMTMGTAGVLLHRFYAQRSLSRSDRLVSTCALVLTIVHLFVQYLCITS